MGSRRLLLTEPMQVDCHMVSNSLYIPRICKMCLQVRVWRLHWRMLWCWPGTSEGKACLSKPSAGHTLPAQHTCRPHSLCHGWLSPDEHLNILTDSALHAVVQFLDVLCLVCLLHEPAVVVYLLAGSCASLLHHCAAVVALSTAGNEQTINITLNMHILRQTQFYADMSWKDQTE